MINQSTNTNWTADYRVPAILQRIERDGAPITRFTDWSESSSGKKEYRAYTGEHVNSLAAIHEEYAAKVVADYTSSAWTAFCSQPRVEDIVRRLNGEWIDYRWEGREGYLTRDDYLNVIDALIDASRLAVAA